MRQGAGFHAELLLQADQLEHLVDAVELFAGQAFIQRVPDVLVGGGGQFQVLEHRECFEDGRLLELAADAAAGDLVLGQFQQVHALAKPDAAGIRTRLAGDDVHHGGLAGAVGADDATQFAVIDVQVQVVQCLEAVKADADVLYIQDRAVGGVDLGGEIRRRLDEVKDLVAAPGFAQLF